jgi:hypothetical protein
MNQQGSREDGKKSGMDVHSLTLRAFPSSLFNFNP